MDMTTYCYEIREIAKLIETNNNIAKLKHTRAQVEQMRRRTAYVTKLRWLDSLLICIDMRIQELSDGRHQDHV